MNVTTLIEEHHNDLQRINFIYIFYFLAFVHVLVMACILFLFALKLVRSHRHNYFVASSPNSKASDRTPTTNPSKKRKIPQTKCDPLSTLPTSVYHLDKKQTKEQYNVPFNNDAYSITNYLFAKFNINTVATKF
jgi:hypothetical protein